MLFLIDVCAGRSIGAWLENEGHSVIYVSDRDPRMPDDDILEWANSEKRIIITIDKDFGKIIFGQSKPHSGIIRLPSIRREKRLELLKNVVVAHGIDLEKGAIVTATVTKIRIRRNSG